MVSERVDRRTRLLDRLRARRTGRGPTGAGSPGGAGAEFVGNGVHLAIGDVAVDAKRVEPEIDGRLRSPRILVGRGVGRELGDRQVVGPLEEETLSVDGALPSCPR